MHSWWFSFLGYSFSTPLLCTSFSFLIVWAFSLFFYEHVQFAHARNSVYVHVQHMITNWKHVVCVCVYTHTQHMITNRKHLFVDLRELDIKVDFKAKICYCAVTKATNLNLWDKGCTKRGSLKLVKEIPHSWIR